MKDALLNPTAVGIYRHILTLVGTYLVARGTLTAEQSQQAVTSLTEVLGSAMVLISIIGSVINKKNQNGNSQSTGGTGSGPS